MWERGKMLNRNMKRRKKITSFHMVQLLFDHRHWGIHCHIVSLTLAYMLAYAGHTFQGGRWQCCMYDKGYMSVYGVTKYPYWLGVTLTYGRGHPQYYCEIC